MYSRQGLLEGVQKTYLVQSVTLHELACCRKEVVRNLLGGDVTQLDVNPHFQQEIHLQLTAFAARLDLFPLRCRFATLSTSTNLISPELKGLVDLKMSSLFLVLFPTQTQLFEFFSLPKFQPKSRCNTRCRLAAVDGCGVSTSRLQGQAEKKSVKT